MATALLNEPETHDVLEQPCRTGHAAFIREVIFKCFGVDNGFGYFDTEKRPCTGAEIAPVGLRRNLAGTADHWHGRDGAGGVVSRGGDNGERPTDLKLLGN